MCGEFKILSEDELDDWFDYYDRLEDKGVYHNPQYMHFMADHFNGRPELLIYEDGKDFVYYSYYKRPITELDFIHENDGYEKCFDIVSSWYYGGPIPSNTNIKGEDSLIKSFNKEFKSFRNKSNIISEFVRFDPLLKNYKLFDRLNPEYDRNTVFVDLSQSEDKIWENLQSRCRRAVRQAKDTKLKIEHTEDEDEIKDWSFIYSDAMEAKNAGEHYRFSYDLFKELLIENKDISKLLISTYEGDVVGGFIIVHDNNVGHHFLSATMPKYWDMRINNLLFYNVILFCKEQGMDIFDFQGGRPGVYKFKKSFSPTRGEFYMGKLIHDDVMYNKLIATAKENGKTVKKDFFPQYRSR